MTLAKIWNMDDKLVKVTLIEAGHIPSDDEQLNRIAIAMMYYNLGLLTKAERAWVEHPNFASTLMLSPNLEDGLHTLQSPFVLKTLNMYRRLQAAQAGATNGLDGVTRCTTNYALWRRVRDTRQPIPYTSEGMIWASIAGKMTFLLQEFCGGGACVTLERILNEMLSSGDTQTTADGSRAAAMIWRVVGKRVRKIGIPTPILVSATAARAAWRTTLVLTADLTIQHISVPINLFDPRRILAQLMSINVGTMIPIARCLYVYDIWELFQLIPFDDNLYICLYDMVLAMGCTDVFTLPPFLTSDVAPTLTSLGGGAWETIGALIQAYTGPVDRVELYRRLLHLSR